jgi:hypothetical protein
MREAGRILTVGSGSWRAVRSARVGSHIGASQEKTRGSWLGSCETAKGDVPIAGSSGAHSRVSKWDTGGTKPRVFSTRSLKELMFGFASREVPRTSRIRAHSFAEKISAIRLKRTPGARLSPPPFRLSWFQRVKGSSLMARYAK